MGRPPLPSAEILALIAPAARPRRRARPRGRGAAADHPGPPPGRPGPQARAGVQAGPRRGLRGAARRRVRRRGRRARVAQGAPRMIAAFQWDLGRQVERLDWLLAQLPRYADWGYRELYLHLEDAVEFPSLPGVARKDAYSQRAVRAGWSARRPGSGIGVVPIVNLLGHTQYLIKVPELRDLNELRAPDGSPLEHGQVCPLHPRMLEVADALIRDIAPFCTAGKVHVGLDESFSLGRHPAQQRPRSPRSGWPAHFGRLCPAPERGRGRPRPAGSACGPTCWPSCPAAIPHLPPRDRRLRLVLLSLRRAARGSSCATSRSTTSRPPSAARGIEYWGCPMNGSFRHEPLPVFGERLANIRDWWRRCRRRRRGRHARHLLGAQPPRDRDDDRRRRGGGQPLARSRDRRRHGHARRAGFERVFGGLSAARGPRPGRARLRRAGLRRLRPLGDQRALGRVRHRGAASRASRRNAPSSAASPGAARPSPGPFRASVEFRRYLAERDVYVRSPARRSWPSGAGCRAQGATDPPDRGRRSPCSIRHAGEFASTVAAGRRAARAPLAPHPRPPPAGSERADPAGGRRPAARSCAAGSGAAPPSPPRLARRIARLRRLAATLRRGPRRAGAAEDRRRMPRPATAPGGSSTARMAIEFRAEAARPRDRYPRGNSASRCRARMRRCGSRCGALGRVGIANVELTDGVGVLRPARLGGPARRRIGSPAPQEGFPRPRLGAQHREYRARLRPQKKRRP